MFLRSFGIDKCGAAGAAKVFAAGMAHGLSLLSTAARQKGQEKGFLAGGCCRRLGVAR